MAAAAWYAYVEREDVETKVVNAVQLPDGIYSATTSYATPLRKVHEIETTITINDNKITNSVVTYDGEALTPPYNPTSSSGQYHIRFESRYQALVVGSTLTEAQSVSRVGGASLTTKAFIDTLEAIAAQS